MDGETAIIVAWPTASRTRFLNGPLLDVAALTGGELREKVEAGAAPHDVAVALLREVAGPAPTALIVEELSRAHPLRLVLGELHAMGA